MSRYMIYGESSVCVCVCVWMHSSRSSLLERRVSYNFAANILNMNLLGSKHVEGAL